MICKHCETENPEESVFCLHCGKRMDSKKCCPSCGELCPEEALFCLHCGKQLTDAPKSETEAQPTYEPQTAAKAPIKQKHGFEKIKSAFDLSGGICLMAAVLFALVFTLCLGLTATAHVNYSGISTSASETTMMWEYFSSAYKDLAESLDMLDSYTGYFSVANYMPVIVSTVVCAGTLVCVLVFTIISAIQYGKHFKNPKLDYGKFAVAAVLSFVLGATAFLAVNSTSASMRSNVKVSVFFSPATLAGIILCGIFLGVYFAFKVVALGKDFLKKQTIVNFVCTLVGILFSVLVAAFAKSPAMIFGIKQGIIVDGSTVDFGINYFNSNILISSAFSPDGAGAMPDNFDATYICSTVAQFMQIAVVVMAFVVLISQIGVFGRKKSSHLGVSIALFALAVVSLVLTCVSLHFGGRLLADEEFVLSIAAAPIVALVASAFVLAGSIVHKVLAIKMKN